MVKFLIGLLTGVVLVILIAAMAVFVLLSLGQQPPSVADGSTLVLRLEGNIPERVPPTFPVPWLEARTPPAVVEVWDLLRKAAADSRIRAVVLVPDGVNAGWGKLQEIRMCLASFRQSGKPLVAFLRSPGTREYYLATAADRIYMPPEDLLNVKGLRAELMYFRKTLDKIGVEVEIEHAGKYKDFGDTFTRASMSPETREVLDSVLDDLYGRLVETIATSRRKSRDEVRGLIDEGPFLAGQAFRNGLVDALAYEDQVFAELAKRLKSGDVKKVSMQDYAKVPASSLGLEGRRRIALLVGEGGITRGGDGSSWDGGGIESGEFVRLLRQVSADAGIQAVVVRIDSPGGDSFASDEIWREMKLLSAKKPMVVSMSDTAASGGYYISMTGDPVVAYPGTFTGSVGVVYGKLYLRGLYDKLGIRKDVMDRGRNAGIDSDYQPLSDAARRKLREAIDDNYRTFITRVAEARKRKFEEVAPLAEGRVWLGSQARERGLIDELGGLDRAIELVKAKARIPRGEKIRLVVYPPKRSILDRLFSRNAESLVDARLRELLPGLSPRLWLRGGVLRVMPYTIQVQ